MRNPLDPFSAVLDKQSHWDPEWYSWLQEVATATTRLEISVPPTTDLSGMEADIATLQAQTTTLQGQVSALQGQVAALQAAPSGSVFLQRQTISSPVSTVVFTGLTAAFDTYVFEGANIRGTVDSSIVFQISLNNGASWVTAGNYYQNFLYSYDASSGTAQSGVHSAFSVMYCGHAVSFSFSPEYSANFTVKAKGLSGTAIGAFTNYMIESGHYHSTNGQMTWFGAGISNAGSSANAVRFFDPGGSLTSGSITLYGVRKT